MKTGCEVFPSHLGPRNGATERSRDRGGAGCAGGDMVGKGETKSVEDDV